jgi:hypothetical protein
MPNAAFPNPPVLLRLLTLFFVFGAVMASLTVVMLLFPGSILEPLWRLNPRAHEGFATMGAWAVVLMLVVATACASAASGLWRRARWGYISAIVILSINLLGDTMNAVITHDWRTLIGLPIGGAMILYLVSKRRAFE